MSPDASESTTLRRRILGKGGLERLLDRWEPGPDQPASSVYLRPGAAGRFLEASGPEGQGWLERLSALSPAVAGADTGLVGLRAEAEALLVIPPFPIRRDSLTLTWDTSPLLDLLAADYTIGVVLLRLGRYAVAVYQGERLLSAKTDTRYVKGRHHAGGTSQKRFQRIREGQIRRIYDKTCAAVEDQFAAYSRRMDYILLGGERFTLNGLLKVCPYLEQFRDTILDRRLNIRDPKRATLEQVAGMLWESRVYHVQW